MSATHPARSLPGSVSPTPSTTPRISIVTVSYNQAAYLEQAMLSVLDQRYPELEYIVIDGGSSDDSVDVIRRHAASLAYWESETDSGQSEALNKGFARVGGDIVGWLNSDDTYQPGTLAAVASAFADPQVNIVMSSHFGLMHADGDIYRLQENSFRSHELLVRFWLTGGMTVNQPCVFFRRRLLETLQPVLDTTLHYAMDYDLWLRMTRSEAIHVVPGHWANYRFHDTSKSGSGFRAFIPEWERVSRRHWGERFTVSWWRHQANYLGYHLLRRLSRLWRRG